MSKPDGEDDGANISDNRFGRFDDELIDKYFNEEGKKAIRAYIHTKTVEARIDELKSIKSATIHMVGTSPHDMDRREGWNAHADINIKYLDRRIAELQELKETTK